MFTRFVKKQTSNKRITQSYIFITHSQQMEGTFFGRKTALEGCMTRQFKQNVQFDYFVVLTIL